MNWTFLQDTSQDWIVLFFILILGIFAFVKSYHIFQLNEFLRLLTNNKYVLIFGKKEKANFIFTFLFLLIQWWALSIALYLIANILNVSFEPLDYFVSKQYIILFCVAFFIILKLIFQKIIIYIFDFSNFSKIYLFIRLSYSNYAGFVLALLLFIIIYAFDNQQYIFYLAILVFLYIQGSGLVTFVKLYKNLIKNYLYYFILYICTFEIAPYLFIGYWIMKI